MAHSHPLNAPWNGLASIDAPPARPPARGSAMASLMSLGVHVVALVVLALVLGRSAKVATEEPPRSAGIVLASRSQDTAYFQSPDAPEPQPNESSPQSASSSAAAAGLPPAGAANDVDAAFSPELPGPQEVSAANSGLLQDVIASTGGRGTIAPGLGDAEILANDPLLNAPPKPALGPTATMKIFGATAVGRSFVMLIDRSKSMGGEGLGAIEAAENELNRAMASLSASQKFQIVAYNQRLAASDPKMVPASDENKKLAAKFMAGIVAHGQTEHRMAILAALRNKPEVIYLFTDGGEPVLNQADLRTITLRADGKTAIHCVQFGFGPLQEEDPFLRRLARLNGGSFAYVDVSQSVR